MTCKDNRDGSCSVEYTPTESGEYDVSIQFAEKHIPGSPFKVRDERLKYSEKLGVKSLKFADRLKYKRIQSDRG